MKKKIALTLTAALAIFLTSEAKAQGIPTEPMKYKAFYDTTKVNFDGIMWFEEFPGKPGTFLVAEQNGKIWVFQHATATKTLYMDFPAKSQAGYHEDGLLGLAFHPRFLENRKVYAYYSPAAKASVLAIAEIIADNSFLKDSGTPLRVIWTTPNLGSHNGATLNFGPDGYLYWAKGQDHGQPGTAQDLKSTRGKMYRIDVDHQDGALAYRIPTDNPFVARTDGALKEIWAYGLRNPMKFTFDALTGDLWETEVGQWFYEDINLIRKGDNLGWDVMEGSNCYTWADEHEPLPTCDRSKLVEPIWSIPHVNPKNSWGNSGTGGIVYRANPASRFYGAYFVGDFCSKQLFAITQKDGKKLAAVELTKLPLGPNHFAVASDGKAYFAGWYSSSVYVSPERSSQILMLDHPELQLGSVNINRAASRPIFTKGQSSYQKLKGVPVGFALGLDANGHEARIYSVDGSRRW